MTVEEISPELFALELYNPNGQWGIEAALFAAAEFGCCDASRLPVRPKTDEYAFMVTWPNGAKYWFHVSPRQLKLIRKRLARREK